MLLSQMEDAIMAKPLYFHHTIEKIYPDGITWIFALWFSDGTTKRYVAVLQKTASEWEVIKYKELV